MDTSSYFSLLTFVTLKGIEMKLFVKSVLAVSVVFGLTNCGGGGSAPEGQQGQQPVQKVGHFIDSAVEGIAYKTDSGIKGFTDKDGKYDYKEGDKVTFSIGKLSLGECTPEINGLVTPKTLSVGNNETKVKILRFLQTIDEDRNPSNGIKIAAETSAAFESIVDEKLISDFADDAEILALNGAIKLLMDKDNDGIIDVDSESALAHFAQSLKELSGQNSHDNGKDTVQTITQNFKIDVSKIEAYYDHAPTKEEKYLAVINYLRSLKIKCNDPLALSGPTAPMEWNQLLADAAKEHDDDMRLSEHYSHEGSGTVNDITAQITGGPSKFYERIARTGFSSSNMSENIARVITYPTPPPSSANTWVTIMEEWMKSDHGHCSNIMNPALTKFGMHESQPIKDSGDSYRVYWSQEFGN